MNRYRSKSAECEAMRWQGGDAQAHAVVLWVNTNGGEARYEDGPYPAITVHTINGWAYATPGHYVVKGSATFLGTNGPAPDGPAWRVRDFYPCDPETFESRWEVAS